MKPKIYSSFAAIDGTQFAFPDYMSFATWFFSLPRRIAVVRFAPDVFKKLERAAAQSTEARRKV